MKLIYSLSFCLICFCFATSATSQTLTVDDIVYDLMGEPFRTQGPFGAPWGQHEAYLEGLPANYDWFGGARPGAWMSRENFGAIAVWGQVYEEQGGSPEENFRVQIRNLALYYFENGKWTLLEQTKNNVGGSWYLTNFDDGTAEGSKRSESSSNGGGISVTLIDGHNFHWWGSKWPRSEMPKTAEAIFAIGEARIIPNTDPDVDLGNVRVLGGTGIDFYTTVDHSAGPNERITSAAIPRHKFLTPEWQYLTMYLVGDEPPESVEDYRDAILSRPLPPPATTGIEQGDLQQLRHFRLYPNVPNPFNPETTLSVEFAEPRAIVVDIFDISGNRIKTLAKTTLPAGRHTFTWNGTDSNGQNQPSGIYVYRVESNSQMETGKMTLLR